METKIIGNWEMKISSHSEIFPEKAINELLKLIENWAKVFPKENTWVQGKFQVPSLFIRIDCIISNGNLFIYEIEERPAGIGICSKINAEFCERLNEIKLKWPEFKLIISPLREKGDDNLWLMPLENDSDGLVLVRAEPNEKNFHIFQERSVSTVAKKGNKSYGVYLELWKEVSDVSQLPWNNDFVLKPLAGSKCKDVVIFLAKKDQGIKGYSTRNQVERMMKNNAKMYIQPFFAPMKCPIPQFKEYAMMYRFFFGYDPTTSKYVPLGGAWVARKNLKIHGASDSLSGPLVF